MNRLFVTALKSVGLVGAGDDPEAQVTFWKSADQEMRDDPSDASKMNPSGETAPDDRSHNVDLSAIEDQDLRKSIEDALAEKDTEKDELQKQVSELTEKVDELSPDPDPVEKADPEVQAFIKEQREKNEKLEKDLAEERSARRTTEFVEKAKAFKDILGKPEDVGPVLADLAEQAPDSFEKLDQWITAAAQQADLSELFEEHGAGEGDPERDPIAAQEQYVSKAKEGGSEKSEAALKAEFWQTSQGREMKKELRS